MSALPTTKSFQNCTETDVPGYNDCPSFLFQVNKAAEKAGRRNEIFPTMRDTYGGNTRIPSIPPPPLTRRISKNSAICKPAVQQNIFTEEEILAKIRGLYDIESRLSPDEFEFYRKKVDSNLIKSLKNDSTKQMLTYVLNESGDMLKGQSILREWLTTDTTISNWCPAFLKIFENAATTEI